MQKNSERVRRAGGHQGYPPGGGETSRQISGRDGTLSEHVTNIVVDGTAAFNKHKASASAMPLSVSHSNVRTTQK